MTSSNAKYTFLLPAYKGAFLREALQSILSQTYTDFKVLVSDDCSPEDLKTIVDEFIDDPRLTYRRNAENMGSKSLVSHWNLLVDMCETEWLIMASDDDVYAPTFLEEVDRLLHKYPQVDVIRARVQRIDAEGDVLQRDYPSDELVSQQDCIFDNYLASQIFCVSNFVYRTTVLRAMGGFTDYPLAWWSDIMTTQRMAAHGMVCTRDILFSFRDSGINISTCKETRISVRQKLLATLQYDRDIRLMLERMSCCETKELSRKYQAWRNLHRQLMLSHYLLLSSNVLSFSEMLHALRAYPEYLNSKYLRYSFVKQWLLGSYKFKLQFVAKRK